MQYKKCINCGSNLDTAEICDCVKDLHTIERQKSGINSEVAKPTKSKKIGVGTMEHK